MDKSGTAQVTVDLKELEALAKEGLPAKFDFSTVEDATGLAISGENLQAVEKTGVELVLPSAEIKLDASALAGVLNQAGKDVQISATQVENSKLTEAQKKLVGDAPTFDFTITSEGKTISDFKGGTATVSVPYTLGKDENPEFITIWLLDDAGKLTPIVAEYAEGKVTFTTGHFSRYAIGYLPFTDVADDWAYEAVVFAYNNQLFSGVGSDKFAPAANMTRGMLWSVLYRMAGSPGKTDDPLWYADAKKWAITETISDGSNPTDYVTREQLTTILYRFAKGKVQKADMSVFADTAQISPFAKDGVSWAVASKILQGDHGSLDPQGNATRAQVAAILQRFAEKV
ncbi:MAG: S-layer homology domain-containing protein [Clostridia bacterium]